MSIIDALRSLIGPDPPKAEDLEAQNVITESDDTIIGSAGGAYLSAEERNAMKLSAVNACVEVLSNSIGKLPIFIIDRKTHRRIDDHPLIRLLTIRPNPVQNPIVAMRMIEANRLCGGNGYAWIQRDPVSMRPVGIFPVQHGGVNVRLDSKTGEPFYTFNHPFTGKAMTNIPRADMIHVMGHTYNGWKGVSVLTRAAEVIGTSRAAQEYSLSYYANGGQPAGVLQTDTDLGGTVTIQNPDGTTTLISKKDVIRKEWRRLYGGPQNAGNIAVLDSGLKYSPISISNRDAQFVEQNELSVQDIARFFGVPLYKLQAGKQSYSSNEQNAVEYVVGTLHPIVEQYEQELTYQLLMQSEIDDGLEIHLNLLAELKGDTAARGNWYRIMRELGAFSVNDIRFLEDLEAVDGGDERYASLNYVPLTAWPRLSEERAAGKGGINQ